VVNTSGIVAFRASDVPNDSTAIWVGDGTDLVKIIEWGQMIDTDLGLLELGFDFGGFDGRQVTSGVIDINDNGQVAFSAFLRNGTIGTFVATPSTPVCAADLNNDGLANFFDVAAFINAFGAQDLIADFTGDGEFNFFDVSDFLSAFALGCP